MAGSLPRFFFGDSASRGDRVVLHPDEARHARVRRLTPGERVALFDGGGHSYVAIVEHSTGKQITVRIDDELPLHSGESPLQLTLAIALLKSDRIEWMIEKVTELGVTRIRPFVCEHSLAQPSPARRQRWQSIALSAAKQCGRSVVPTIDGPCDFAEMLTNGGANGILFWEASADTVGLNEPCTAMTLAIGPEGGFTETEVEHARRAGFRIATLGPRILRAETAAVAAVTLAQHAWGDIARANLRT